MDSTSNLKHHLLLAMPSLSDPYFGHSVCYICDHNEQGSMGLVLNKPMGIELTDVLSELDIETDKPIHFPILQGGPVSPEQGFVLYRGSESELQNMVINGDIRLTTSKDILSQLALGSGPDDVRICLGYAGWEAGQLEQELIQNAWLTVPADEELLFHTPMDQMLEKAASRIGVDMSLISGEAGHA
ncbi:YqgE/AlgH family protein [Bermanella marisrubri]|uniref:UPF0301 protein RED65_07299 n=1 Tax=Bermanella marisrubri TaxID=207949 RepID=Q1MZ13_9GAMM|nr:YqgE/AlgH family protein [Bermanella marisrubri]EAT11215.1 hypothetical protein RED65_07299 [Oceanobacter sp. RED65] [Bermanella marisrubri]QIZ85650.1 YqgE/AlgH family protein [Bermanella marisrubri]